MVGRTVFPALASTNHSFELGRGTLGTAIWISRNACDEGTAPLFRHCNISSH